MADTAAEAAAYSNVEVEDIGPSRKKLTITISSQTVDDAIENSYAAVSDEAALPGFRRGRVPRKLLEKRFGTEVQREAKNQLVASAYSRAVEDQSLSVVGEPEGKDLQDLTLEGGHDAIFSVEVDVAPEFETPELENIEIDKPIVEITGEHVDSQLKHLCKVEGELEAVERASPGDYIIGHGKLMHGEETVLDLPGAVVQIPAESDEGKGMILGVIVEDLGEQLGTPAVGDDLDVYTTGPENHENVAIRGEKIHITFSVSSTQRIVPVSAAQLVSRYGLADETQLRENLELRLNQRAVGEQQAAMRQQVARQLMDAVEFDLPERLSAGQTERNLNRRRYELLHRGMPQDQVEKQIAEMRGDSAEAAVRELKLFFILNQVAKQLDVEVTEEEVRGRIAQIAAQQRMTVQDVIARLQETNQMGMIMQQIREHKAMDAIIEKAKVTDVPAEEYNKKARGEADLSEVAPSDG